MNNNKERNLTNISFEALCAYQDFVRYLDHARFDGQTIREAIDDFLEYMRGRREFDYLIAGISHAVKKFDIDIENNRINKWIEFCDEINEMYWGI